MLRVFLCAVLKADKQKSLFSKNGKRAFLKKINRKKKRVEYLLLFQKKSIYAGKNKFGTRIIK